MRISLVLAMLAAGCATQSPTPVTTDDAASLAAAETAFAAQSVREDMRVAFLAHFQSDGVYVRKGWVGANADLSPRAAPPIVLDWRPVHTEVAASGEMGLSTGPWKATSKANAADEPGYGQYVSIWKREGSGPWKVAVDIGISNPGNALWDTPLDAQAPGVAVNRDEHAVQGAEKNFQAQSLLTGAAGAYRTFASPRIRLYREGAEPAVGRDAAFKSPAMVADRFIWTTESSEVARSGDFGYARGHYASANAPDKVLGYFMRVWRPENGQWRIVMDVVNPAS
ncbi:MAG TPA: nuclear transport factor 2 family protein [Usitatibacter sp.]|jgi:ketosteroid isomerase-like protein